MPLAVVAESERANASDKQPGAFRTIGEVAEELDVPQHVLRFWESRFAQIRPLKRGGNRRYYRPDDVDLLRGVKRLLHGQGYTIRGAQRVLKQYGVRFVQAVGRGDVQAGPPAPAERAPEHDGDGSAQDGAAQDQAAQDQAAQDGLGRSERAALQGALDELRACRAILAGLAPDRLDLT